MNRSRKIMKKLTAAAAASALVLSGTSQVFAASYKAVSYTHLDVYKRQLLNWKRRRLWKAAMHIRFSLR